MPEFPHVYDTVDACVDYVIERVGRDIRLAAPLGIGKPNHLINALYRRAARDKSLRLTLFTALSLDPPTWSGELERRLAEPINRRLFGDYPRLDYIADLKAGRVPENITISEFYFQPGAMIGNSHAQQNYRSSNYTHVGRDILAAGVNVLSQLVSKGEEDGEHYYSLSGNTDVTLDLLPYLARDSEEGTGGLLFIGQVNNQLPFMRRQALVKPGLFDAVVDNPEDEFTLFGPPRLPVDITDHMIGLAASSLIRDGGTLQIGIGTMGDAIAHATLLRHRDNDGYRRLLRDTWLEEKWGDLIDALGGREPFETGLYGATEMLVDGFVQLYDGGVLKRRVYDNAAIHALVEAGRLQERLGPETLDVLFDESVIGPELSQIQFRMLQRTGILDRRCELREDHVWIPDYGSAGLDMTEAGNRRRLAEGGLGHRLADGTVAHAAFFLGPPSFYERLRNLTPEDHETICMTSVGRINQLYGGIEQLDRLQRRDARFMNTGMMCALNGAVVSDGFEDGQVLSGVGGQYNFVAMAHALEDGRSILMVRAVRERGSEVSSNIVWNYGHVTIPRHLRDIVITEYGIADLRGKSDAEVIAALLNVADSRFQYQLMTTAKQAGKLPRDYVIPQQHRHNTPERLTQQLRPYRRQGLMPDFPFGTELQTEEVVLARALKKLQSRLAARHLPRLPGLNEWKSLLRPPASARPYLQRMGLEAPRSWKERAMQKTVLYALAMDGILGD